MPVLTQNYFHKYESLPTENPLWNLPETKQGSINIIGGHAGSFRTVVKTAELLAQTYPIQEASVVLPDALAEKMPKLPNFAFLSSTESGSFKDAEELAKIYSAADFNILIGDFSKNEITRKALKDSLNMMESSQTKTEQNKSAVTSSGNRGRLLLTRDTVDLLATETATDWLQDENITILASLAQLQKLFRAIYYPKMLLLSQSLLQVSEAIHKFTLSFPVGIVTLHDGKIIIAKAGEVAAVDLEKSGYSPFLFWNGEIAAKIAALNLYNPQDFLNATLAGVFTR